MSGRFAPPAALAEENAQAQTTALRCEARAFVHGLWLAAQSVEVASRSSRCEPVSAYDYDRFRGALMFTPSTVDDR
jgi:hypothetical protein